MPKTIHEPSSAPKAAGPYSVATEANGFVFVSGQVGIDPAVGSIVDGGVVAQCHQIMTNLGAILADLVDPSRTGYVAPYHLAYIHTGLGEHDRAIDCLERAFEERAGAMYGVKGSFLFEPLRSHPRFRDLLGRMNL